jgi:large repetitive protein
LRLRFKKLRPIQNFELYKEKEMPEFRKLIIALAVVALFAGLASAQVGTSPTGVASGLPLTCGVTNGAVTPTLRAEGYTEETGDIVIVCSGGTPLAAGSIIPTANITLFLNTTVTSRLLPTTTASNASEALLLVDEPGSGLTGYGPSLAQNFCAFPTVGAGPGGCVEYVSAGGVPVTAPGGVVTSPNVFQGVTSGNQVTFYGIPVQPPATAGLTSVYRITNVRVNANGITAGGATPGSVTASVSINSSTSLAITNSTLTVGFVQQGLSPTNTLLRSNGNTGSASSSGTGFAQCSSASVTSTSSATAAVGIIQFQENFATAFKIRQNSIAQNVPGAIYNSESNFIAPYVTSSSTTLGTTSVAGLADYATRLKATFSNVPSGVSLYVSTHDVINDFNGGFTTPYTASQAVLVVSESASDGPSGAGPSTVAQSSTFGVAQGASGGVGGNQVPYAPVAINASTGTGLAVWEIINTNPNAIDTVGFGLFINYSANAAANSPAPGTITVTLSFAPTPSGGAFTSTTGAASSSTLPIPRFSDSLDITKNVANFSLCTTPMLFPYVINVNGFDTGLAIANTTTDPFGTAAQNGTCSLYFYGSSAPTTEPFVSPIVATGTVYTNLASTLAPGFAGYMIANCNFQFAHGFAFVSDVGARNLAMGYLALIFTSTSRSATEALNN